MNFGVKEELLRVVIYLALIYFVTKRLKKNEQVFRQRKGFNRVPDWMFKLTFWNVVGGWLFFSFSVLLIVLITAFTDKYLRPHLVGRVLMNDLPRALIELTEVLAFLWLGFWVGKKFWKTWSETELSFWDFAAFVYYSGFVVLLAVSLFNFTEGIMTPYAAAGPSLNILVSLLGLFLECSLIAWLAFEGWLRIWSTIQGKSKPSNG